MILDTVSFGAILRIYAKEPTLAPARAAQAVNAAVELTKIVVNGKKFFRRIDILIAADPDFVECDCGQTAKLVRSLLRGRDSENLIFTTEVKNGDLFCGVLNFGIAHQVRTAKIDYTCIISPEATSFATSHVITGVLAAVANGAKVVDVAFGELSPSVHLGRLANTFCFWHNESLQLVGGFDLKASALEKEDPQAVYLRAWKKEEGEVYYPRSGVEEIIPLLRLTKEFGGCLSVVDADKGEWKIPDSKADPTAYERHCHKMEAKLVRQTAMAFSLNADLTCLEGGLMQ